MFPRKINRMISLDKQFFILFIQQVLNNNNNNNYNYNNNDNNYSKYSIYMLHVPL